MQNLKGEWFECLKINISKIKNLRISNKSDKILSIEVEVVEEFFLLRGVPTVFSREGTDDGGSD